LYKTYAKMPPIRTARASKKAPPEGFEDIEDTLLEFQNKMKDAENASHEGKKKYEMTWPIFQITHQRSRYIYDLYYEKEAISKQLYDYLLKNGYADAMLIAKWKKQGYEKVCGLWKSYIGILLTSTSSAAPGAYRPRRPTSARHAFAEYRANSSRRIRTYSVSTAGAEDADRVTERRDGLRYFLVLVKTEELGSALAVDGHLTPTHWYGRCKIQKQDEKQKSWRE
jgi:hypothetical protein